MSITSLVSGSLFRNLEHKTSQAGKPYLSGTLKVGSKDDGCFVRLFVFGETACEEMDDLKNGDGVAVVGNLRVEIYEGRLSYSMAVNRALALKKEKRPTKQKLEAKALQHERVADFDDAIPF